MKSARYFVSVIMILSIITAASSCNGGKKMESKNETILEATAVTEMQKLMAEKAFKMPGENNPVVAHKYGADPAILIYKDTLYLYTTNDMQQFEFTKGKTDNGYNKITSLNVFSTKDLVNWTDCGEIKVAGKNDFIGAALWASNSWAPAVCWKNINGKDKFFIYFADSGNGIGVLEGESPVGPFVDPIKEPLISRKVPTCEKINWLFDPAVIVDDDGQAYIYFGGGHDPDKYEHPMNARCAALSEDMVHLEGEPKVIDAPFLFEDSGINKIGDTWYYTYCTNWADRKDTKDPDKMPIAVIGYMTSKNPLGPFEYKGYTLENPGTIFGAWGNNHHWIFNFRGNWYIAYHTQTLEKTVGSEKGGYRNIFIDHFAVNADGSLPIQKSTKKGVEQLGTFALGDVVPAATMASSRNAAVTSRQTVVAVKDGAYLCLKGVEFKGTETEFSVECIPVEGKSIKLSIDGIGSTGTEIGTKFSGINGVHDLYIILPEGVELISWRIK
ncbi:family 43 glycosylhydrolase [Treponema bryantii]|uniref:family 43 glycosylhydrolase n=1 Tax=Treponema bryantii TaxID=163 RepID=UPI0030C80E55